MSRNLIKLLFCLFVVLSLFTTSLCSEDMCSANKEHSTPSCGSEKYDELEIKDEKQDTKYNMSNTKSDSSQDSSLEYLEEDSKQTISNSKEGKCEIINGEKKCGDEISINSNSRADYYSKKKKSYKKPQPKPIEYPESIKYEDLFSQKGHERQEYLDSLKNSNYTDYFDFSLDKEEIEYLRKERLAIYPPKKFRANNQGNFLHFYKVAYEKQLPVMFSIDSMLFAVNENVYRIMTTFLENVFIFSLKKFFENMVHYGEQLKENTDLAKHKLLILSSQIYFGAGANFLQDGFSEYQAPSDIQGYVSGLAGLARKFSNFDFTILLKKRTVNTAPLRPNGYWRRTKKLGNIYTCLRFYSLFKLDLRSDLKSIFFLGKMIVDSNNRSLYYELREMIQYLIGEEHTTPDFVQVYELGKELLGPDVYELDDQQLDLINRLITKKVDSKTVYMNDLVFLNDYILYSAEAYGKYRYDKEDTSFLFNKNQNVEDWVLNKLVEIKPEGARLMVSSFELVDIMHGAGAYRTIIQNRYKGKETFQEEQLMRFRDGIDLTENFDKTKYSIKKSMENEPNNWRKNLQFHYHYLLYKATRRIKHSQDPIWKSNLTKENNFYTAWGAHVHFKKQIILMTNRLIPEAPKNQTNGIPEVYLEPHLEFYKELETFWNNFKSKINEFTAKGEVIMEINYSNIKSEIKRSLDNMSEAISIILKGIKLQETGQLTTEYKDNLRNLIKYDEDSKWSGWYTNLFDNFSNPNDIFNFDVLILNAGQFPEANRFDFQGASLFNIMRFPNIGVITVEDPHEKVKKLLLFTKYNVREVYMPLNVKPNINAISQEILDRE